MTGGLRTPLGSCAYDNYGSIQQHMPPTHAGQHMTRSTYNLSVRREVCRKSTTKCTKKRPIWLALSTRLANPVWTFLPSGSPLSAMRSTFHREDLYDVTEVHLFLLGFRVDSHGFTPRMTLVVGSVLTSSP
jgi:hypothetical protein